MFRQQTVPVPSPRTVQRALGVLLVGFLATYAGGTVVEGVVPWLGAVGILAVHLAVVVGLLFPLAVLGHAVVGRRRPESIRPSRLEVAVAAVVLGSLLATALPVVGQVSEVLFAVAVGGVLVLAGLVLGRD